MDLSGRNAVITGGGRGIGAAVARALAEAGASILIASRTRKDLDEVAGALEDEDHTVWTHPCDVSRESGVRALRRAAERRLGQVDILVNNAGISPSNPIKSISLEEWNRVFAVNSTGTFLCTQAFLPGMIERGWGRVINVASVAGRTGGAYIAAYSASKHAVLGFTRCAAAEVAGKGVTVNAVCPGYVDTDMTDDSIQRIVRKTGLSYDQALQRILDSTPQKRLIGPEEVAFLVLSLCDEQARGINGQAIVLDGGALLA